jgi:glycerol-3-phosphate dehydrogenase (NAD(P)+)
MISVGVVGATSWGTTLGIVLARQGCQVSLWARSEKEANVLRRDGQNRRLLPGFPFPETLRVSVSLEEAFSEADAIVFGVPSATLRSNVEATIGSLSGIGTPLIVSACKGLERDSGKSMTQVLRETLPAQLHGRICVLSGPNLAREVVAGKPASTVAAASDKRVATEAQDLFMSDTFRVYTNTDIIGVELAGALKNIIALGAGISDGLGYGENAKATFVTRGLAEITRLGVAAGANPLTFAGLAGMGDLVATCFSHLSRNHYVGEELAKGRSLKQILTMMNQVAEGIDTTVAALQIAAHLDVEMPITEMTHRILFEGMAPRQAVAELMSRAPSTE